MKKTFLIQFITVSAMMVLTFTSVWAQSPIRLLQNIGKNVETDPQKEYRLTEMDGPFLIFAAAFYGPNARQDAHSLVLELRKTYKWNAFVCEKTFAFDVNKDFKQAKNPHTGMTAKYNKPGGGTEIAVLIGNFPSMDDKQFNKTLAEVKKCQPATLRGKSSETPFSMAFGVSNPMLPLEHQRGVVDAFIESLNKNRSHSLLKNPRRYTVQIATFTGMVVTKGSELDKFNSGNSKKMTDLEKGEKAAVALCKALRDRGVEAYEFHDRYCSIVTVGSFDQPARQLANGTLIPDPQIQQIIQRYQAQKVGNATKIVVIDGIECDPVPIIIEVPRPRR